MTPGHVVPDAFAGRPGLRPDVLRLPRVEAPRDSDSAPPATALDEAFRPRPRRGGATAADAALAPRGRPLLPLERSAGGVIRGADPLDTGAAGLTCDSALSIARPRLSNKCAMRLPCGRPSSAAERRSLTEESE